MGTEGIDQPQTIVRFESRNVKRLRAVEITPAGELVIVGGKNAQGKTSVIDSIMFALAGKRAIPDRPVRDGEKKAEINIETQDLLIRRSITPAGGGQLTVQRKPGVSIKKPQTVLDDLTGDLSFDPLEFTRLDRKAQAEQLRALVGLDTTEIDARREAAFNQRREVKREHKALMARSALMPHDPTAPEEEQSSADILAELEQAEQTNRAFDAQRDKLDELRRANTAITAEIASLEQKLDTKRERKAELVQEGQELKAVVDGLVDVDTAEIKERLANLEDLNRRARANKQRVDLGVEALALEGLIDEHTEAITKADEDRQAAIAAASMPVDGLALDADGVVTYDGIPFDQCSQAEQLRISLAMGIAANPEIRVLLLRDGSLLDDDNMQLVAEMAAESGCQVWIERVADGDEGAIIIEDGAVRDV